MSRRSRRKKYINRSKKTEKQRKEQAKRTIIVLSVVFVLIVAAVITLLLVSNHRKSESLDAYKQKAELLKDAVTAGDRQDELLDRNVEGIPEQVVFISISDGNERAQVFTGTGKSVLAAWEDADEKAMDYVSANALDPRWVKADLLSQARLLKEDRLSVNIANWRNEFFRWGVAFDRNFDNALLESEMNGAKIYNYEDDCIDFSYLNTYLRKAGRPTIKSLPHEFVMFRTIGWICDEDNEVYELLSNIADYGRRDPGLIDKEKTAEIVRNASGYLMDQVLKDGSFIYGYYPRFGNEIEDYNIVRHAGSIWSLVCQYRMTGDDALISKIESTIDYMLDGFVLYEDDDTAHLYEKKSDEIKLGGTGIAILALTEYMDAFDSDKYVDIAVKLGNGILTMLDQKTGEYFHVLNGNFSRKEEFRTIYYDGEATFALCRLYSLTGDEKWLNAAVSAVEHFIDADYVQYKDHWIAYAMTEITQYVQDPRYYDFALRNANENLAAIYGRDTTYHTYLELIMSTFQLYDRMIENGIHTDYLENEFDLPFLLKTIYKRVDHQLNGYFYPEYAMYMKHPNTILDTFMVRHDGYRVRIDDVQHNVGGYYLYYKNYDKLVEYGMLNYKD